MICVNCGFLFFEGEACPQCGAPVAESKETSANGNAAVSYMSVFENFAPQPTNEEKPHTVEGFKPAKPAGPVIETGATIDAVSGDSTSDSASVTDISAEESAHARSRKGLIIGIAVAATFVVVAAAVVLLVYSTFRSRINKYNSAMNDYTNGDYAEACEQFAELGSFRDSEDYVMYCQVTIEYLKVDEYAASHDFDKVIACLKAYQTIAKDSREAGKVAELIAEYGNVKEGYEYKDRGNYLSAQSEFGLLDVLECDYASEYALCGAYLSVDSGEWPQVFVYLYALQTGDYKCDFFNAPATEEAWTIVSFAESNPVDYSALTDIERILEPADEEQETLYSAAMNALRYEYGVKLYDDESYAAAMDIFEQLGDYSNSKFMYDQCEEHIGDIETQYTLAQKYYDDGEYYKAKKTWEGISGYKDSDQKARKCVQSMPDNDSMKIEPGGSVEFELVAPHDLSALVRIYDQDGDLVAQVFIAAGKSTVLNLDGGTYEVRFAMGTEWYGDKGMFGADGYYRRLVTDDNELVVEFEGGCAYNFYLHLSFPVDGSVLYNGVDGM